MYLYKNSCLHTTGSCKLLELHQPGEISCRKLRIIIDAIWRWTWVSGLLHRCCYLMSRVWPKAVIHTNKTTRIGGAELLNV